MNTIGTIVGLQGPVNCLERLCADRDMYRRFHMALPHLLVALDAGDGRTTFTRFFARNAVQHQLRHFGGMDTFLEFTLTGEMAQMHSVFQQIRDCAVYTNEYEGIIALDIGALANYINEAQVPYFLEQVKRCGACATIVFYIPRTPSRNLSLLVSKLHGCLEDLIDLKTEPYTAEELAQIAVLELEKRGVHIQDARQFHGELTRVMTARQVKTATESCRTVLSVLKWADLSGFTPTVNVAKLRRAFAAELNQTGRELK